MDGQARSWVGDAIARERRAKRLSLDEVASRMGVTPEVVAAMERGECMPNVRELRALSRALAIRPPELAYGRRRRG